MSAAGRCRFRLRYGVLLDGEVAQTCSLGLRLFRRPTGKSRTLKDGPRYSPLAGRGLLAYN